LNNPTPTRHERRRQQTRQKLIQAAIELLIAEGYEELSIQAITDRADLGRGTFYIHFKDKDDVVWSAVKDLILELEQQAHGEAERSGSGPKEYFGLVKIFRHAGQHADLYRIILGGKGSALLLRQVEDLIAQAITRDIRAAREMPGASATIPEEILAQALTGLITRELGWWLEAPNPYTAEEMAEFTYRVIYNQAPSSPSPAGAGLRNE
jgi:AcrR family transcriptional regulator